MTEKYKQAPLVLLGGSLIHFTDTVFLQLKVPGNPAWGQSVGTISQQHLLILCLCVTFGQFSQHFTFFQYHYICYDDLCSVIFNATAVIVWGHHKPPLYKTVNLINKCCV